jgi:hypothetical protein
MQRDMVGLIALYLILRFILASVNHIALKLQRGCSDAHDPPAHATCLEFQLTRSPILNLAAGITAAPPFTVIVICLTSCICAPDALTARRLRDRCLKPTRSKDDVHRLTPHLWSTEFMLLRPGIIIGDRRHHAGAHFRTHFTARAATKIYFADARKHLR